MSAWVRRLGWRVCIANGIAKLRCSPRVNEGKGRQKTSSGPKGMREKHRGAEQADKTRNGNGKKAQMKENINTRSYNGAGTTNMKRVDSETKKRLRVGSWNVCGFAMEERRRMESAEQISAT